MAGTLGERLRAVRFDTPPTLVSSALVGSARPTATTASPVRHRFGPHAWRWAAVAVVVLLGSNLAAYRVFPSYRVVLAATPGVGPATVAILDNLGLGGLPPATGVTPLGASAVANGVQVQVVAGYADSIQTVLILKAPNGLEPWSASGDGSAAGPTLTDQFGDSYATSPGWPEYRTAGEVSLSFPPLTDHADSAGGSLQLTLRIPEMYTPHQSTQSNPYGCPCVTLPGVAPGPKGGRNLVGAPMVPGPWTVTFTLTPDAGQAVALPAPVTSGGTTYTLTEVRESYPFLYIQWDVSGAAIAQTPGTAPTPASLPWTRNFVVPPSGQTANVLQGGGQLVAPWKYATMQALVRVSGPGTYKLLLGGPASDPAATFVFHMR